MPTAVAGRGLLCVFMLCGGASVALAAEANPSEHAGAIFIVQLALLLVVGRGLGELMQRFGQPAIVGQLLGGLILGPSLLGAIWPDVQHLLFPPTVEQRSMLNAVSQLGILMLLLLTGMETDLRLIKRAGRAAVSASAAGVALPFIGGFWLGEMLPDLILPIRKRVSLPRCFSPPPFRSRRSRSSPWWCAK